jgi:hypothetical protein
MLDHEHAITTIKPPTGHLDDNKQPEKDYRIEHLHSATSEILGLFIKPAVSMRNRHNTDAHSHRGYHS